jgi:hypothetical protein
MLPQVVEFWIFFTLQSGHCQQRTQLVFDSPFQMDSLTFQSNGPSADDRETPLTALEDLLPILSAVADLNQFPLNQLAIYDPYFCHGGIKIHLESLGLDSQRIQNEPIDCYVAQKSGKVQPFDILVSNPPYSGDHIRRCLHYSVKSQKPWSLLLPSNVIHRSWFQEEMKNSLIFYLAPHRRYEFVVRETAQSHIPMVTMWFIGIPSGSDELKAKIFESWSASAHTKRAVLTETFEGLPRKIRKLLPFTEVHLSLTSYL